MNIMICYVYVYTIYSGHTLSHLFLSNHVVLVNSHVNFCLIT